MKTEAAICSRSFSTVRARLLDYVELVKPRMALLVVFTVAAGAWLAARGVPDLPLLADAVLGTALVVGGACALNQYLERDVDARMTRTESRPLPAGRLLPQEALLFGGTLATLGVVYLAFALPRMEAALLAAFACFSYVFIYTPLKPLTSMNTLVGAVPGALPPVIGWTAVRGRLEADAVILFLIIFFWQVPHFLAIAWLYRRDYKRAGLCMLPVVDPRGRITSRQMVLYCLALLSISLLPALRGSAGPLYFAGAGLLGLGFLAATAGFMRSVSDIQARRVLRASLLYLPALLSLLAIDQWLSAASF
jgi:protoheme IX farnesyltransferase